MEHNFDIVCKEVMSSSLYYQLTEYLIPLISNNINKYSMIKIVAPLTSEPINRKSIGVGASLSGGVDSFYSLLRHVNRREKEFNITHLTFFNAGASGALGGDSARRIYYERIAWIENVAQKLKLPLVCVDTNINEFLKQGHEATHSFRTLAIPLILQKLFCKYYFASGFDVSRFCFSSTDTAKYDLLITQCISNTNLKFYLSGSEASRLLKIDFISKSDITYDTLNVCTAKAVNCSRCDKCIRTMLELYSLDKLELYKNVFDIEYFYKFKHKFIATMLALRAWHERDDSQDWDDIYVRLKKEIKINHIVEGWFILFYRIIRRKLYRIKFIKIIYNKFIK